MKLRRLTTSILLIEIFILLLYCFIEVYLYPKISYEDRIIRNRVIIAICGIMIATCVIIHIITTKEITNKVILRLTPFIFFAVYFIVVYLFPQISFEGRMSMLFAMIVISVIPLIIILKKETKKVRKRKIIILSLFILATIIMPLISYYWR